MIIRYPVNGYVYVNVDDDECSSEFEAVGCAEDAAKDLIADLEEENKNWLSLEIDTDKHTKWDGPPCD